MAAHSMAPSDSEVAETLEDIKKHLASGLSLCCCISAMGRYTSFLFVYILCRYTSFFFFGVYVGRVGEREREVLSLDISSHSLNLFLVHQKSYSGMGNDKLHRLAWTL